MPCDIVPSDSRVSTTVNGSLSIMLKAVLNHKKCPKIAEEAPNDVKDIMKNCPWQE